MDIRIKELSLVLLMIASASIIIATNDSDSTFNAVQSAKDNYTSQLKLVNEQQARVNYLYETKSDVRDAINEYQMRLRRAVESGENYRSLLNKSSLNYNNETAWIDKNRGIVTFDLNLILRGIRINNSVGIPLEIK